MQKRRKKMCENGPKGPNYITGNNYDEIIIINNNKFTGRGIGMR